MVYVINGVRCENEKAVRDYCFNFTDPKTAHAYAPQGYRQDFRLAAIAYTAPLVRLVETLEKLGHKVDIIE